MPAMPSSKPEFLNCLNLNQMGRPALRYSGRNFCSYQSLYAGKLSDKGLIKKVKVASLELGFKVFTWASAMAALSESPFIV